MRAAVGSNLSCLLQVWGLTSGQLVGVKGAVGDDGTWLPVVRLVARAGAPAGAMLDPALDCWVHEEHGRRSTREVGGVQETCTGVLARCCRSMAWVKGSVVGVRMVREACAWGNGMGVECICMPGHTYRN